MAIWKDYSYGVFYKHGSTDGSNFTKEELDSLPIFSLDGRPGDRFFILDYIGNPTKDRPVKIKYHSFANIKDENDIETRQGYYVEWCRLSSTQKKQKIIIDDNGRADMDQVNDEDW